MMHHELQLKGSREVRRGARTRRGLARGLVAVACGLVVGCGRTPAVPEMPLSLASYGLFDDLAGQQPAAGVVPYELNSALFSDYTSKRRFVKLPEGETARVGEDGSIEFPVGTVIAKTFSMPADLRDPASAERLLETRILIHQADGWVGLPYIWNAEQTAATLSLAGGILDVSWTHTDGAPRTNNYLVPNLNQCKGCHRINGRFQPIGPKLRHLNRDYLYPEGAENQLTHWSRQGILTDAPPPETAPRLAAWDDPASGSLERRARAWLEINCAHCHQPGGPAQNSGLDLLASQEDPVKYGVFKPPVAAGRGSGGLKYDLVPGDPDASILVHRIASTHPDVMMPELGKRLVHEEGVALIREWVRGKDEGGRRKDE